LSSRNIELEQVLEIIEKGSLEQQTRKDNNQHYLLHYRNLSAAVVIDGALLYVKTVYLRQ